MIDGPMPLLVPLCVLSRIPRLVEGWKAPFRNGPGWFLGVQAEPGFLTAAGQAVLSQYRMRSAADRHGALVDRKGIRTPCKTRTAF